MTFDIMLIDEDGQQKYICTCKSKEMADTIADVLFNQPDRPPNKFYIVKEMLEFGDV